MIYKIVIINENNNYTRNVLFSKTDISTRDLQFIDGFISHFFDDEENIIKITKYSTDESVSFYINDVEFFCDKNILFKVLIPLLTKHKILN